MLLLHWGATSARSASPPLPHAFSAAIPRYRLPRSPNYLSATIEGDLHILFYRTVAGRSQIQRLRLPPRAAPKVGWGRALLSWAWKHPLEYEQVALPHCACRSFVAVNLSPSMPKLALP